MICFTKFSELTSTLVSRKTSHNRSLCSIGYCLDELPIDAFLQGIRRWTKNIPQDPEKWTFGGLERNSNGSFPDDKLVEIVQDATESVAGM